MLAALFTLAVVGSLFTSGLLFFEVIPGSPFVLVVVGGAHGIFAGGFFYVFSQYRALHGLVLEGRGELFEMAIAARIGVGMGGGLRARLQAGRDGHEQGWLVTRLIQLLLVDTPGRQGDGDVRFLAGLKEHYRLRRVEGLQLTGLPRLAVGAGQGLHVGGHEFSRGATLDLAAALALSNLELDRAWWAKQHLDAVADDKGAVGHGGLNAAHARLALMEGRFGEAATLLEPFLRMRHFPFTRVLRARNRLWYGDALVGLGRAKEAQTAYADAERAAPRSVWADRARVRGLAVVHETSNPMGPEWVGPNRACGEDTGRLGSEV